MRDWRLEAAQWAKTQAFRRRHGEALASIEAPLREGDVLFSSSWGKDSTALCGLALEVIGRPTIIHLASPYALPGDELVHRHFAERANVQVVPYRRSLAEYISWLREIGLGYERAQRAGVGGRAKASLAGEWAQEHDYRVMALGIRAEESGQRRKLLLHRGATYERKDGLRMVYPLAWWRARDTWAYIHVSGLPYHPMYDMETHGFTRETLRNGGWLTTIEPGRLPWLRAHYPEQYRMLTAAFPQVSMMGG